MKRAGALSALLVAALTTGCFVEVHHVDDPGRAFDQARAEAARVAGRPGRAHEVNVLVYEPDDGQLVTVSVPLWLARKIAKHEGGDLELGDEVGERVRGRLERRLRLEDLERAGRGVMVEVQDDDGSQVLVWLR
jgi:hypothetical protein